MQAIKTCKECGRVGENKDFHGFLCKWCRSKRESDRKKNPISRAKDREYHYKNKSDRNKKSKEHRDKNKEQINAKRREKWTNDEKYRQNTLKKNKDNRDKNKEVVNAKKRENRKNNPEYFRAMDKKSKDKNKAKVKVRKSNYYQKNKATLNEYKKDWTKTRRKQDPIFALQKSASAMVSKRLSQCGGSKNGQSASDYFPWTDEQLWDRLEALFLFPENLGPDGKPWMTRFNRGKHDLKTYDPHDISTWTWQLDHINPHSVFNYTTMDCQEFRDCHDLTNLRPLSAQHNNSDKHYRTPEQINAIKTNIQQFLDQQEKKKEVA